MRKTLSILTIAVAALSAAPAATAKSDQTRSLISPGTCATITKLANEGKPVPDPSILRDADSVPSYFQSGVLKYKVADDFPYREQLDAAVAEWNDALDGKASLKEVAPSEADEDTIAIIYKPEPNGYVQGTAYPDHGMLSSRPLTLSTQRRSKAL